MPKFEIDMNFKASASKGALGAAPKSRESIRESMSQVTELKKTMGQLAKKDPSSKYGSGLAVSMSKLDKSLNKLTASIDKLTAGVNGLQRGLGRPGGGPGGGGGGGGLGGGSGIGRMGGAVPLVGAMVGAFGYALSKVLDIGRASMSKIMEQRSTAGVAGLQTSGRYTGVFSAAEYGQFMKERKMAAGRFESGAGEYGGTLEKGAPLSMKATAIFGTGSEFAKTSGLMDIFSRQSKRTGEQDMNEVIRRTFTGEGKGVRGIETELPLLLREVTSGMEEAVREGVNGSDMAKDMAQEVTRMARVAPGGQIRSVLQTQKSLMSLQQQAAKGQGGGFATWRMNMSAKGLLMGGGGQSDKVRAQLEASGLLSKEQAKALKAGEQLPPEQMQFLVQSLQAQQSGIVRSTMLKDVVGTLGGEGSREEKLARFHRIAQTTMPEMALTPQKSAQLFDHTKRLEAAEKYDTLMNEKSMLEKSGKGSKRLSMINTELQTTVETRGETGELRKETIAEIGKAMKVSSPADAEAIMNRRLGAGAGVRGIQSQMGARESLLFSEAAASARNAVTTIETSFVNLAGQVSGPVSQAIDSMNNGIVTLTNGIGSAISEMTSFVSGIQNLKKELSDPSFMGIVKGVTYLKTGIMK